jgi:hypothetical protein
MLLAKSNNPDFSIEIGMTKVGFQSLKGISPTASETQTQTD